MDSHHDTPAPEPTPPLPVSTDSSRRSRLCDAGLMLVLVGLTLLAFAPSLRNGFISYDDPEYVTQTPQVLRGFTSEGFRWSWTTMKMGAWMPLTWWSLMLDAELYHAQAWGYRLSNILLHACSAAMLYLLLRSATARVAASFFVAAIFAVHPLRVESVAWIAERKDVLSVFFMMASLLAYVKYGRSPQPRWYFATLLAFIASLMSKPMMVTAPALLLLLDYWPLQRLELRTRSLDVSPQSSGPLAIKCVLLEKLPFLALSLAVCVLTIIGQKNAGAVVDTEKLSLVQRLANVPVSYVRYVVHMIDVRNLAVLYPLVPQWNVALVAACTIALLVITLVLLRLHRTVPFAVVGWFWFLGTLVPVIGIVQVGAQSIADRYTYFPTIGLLIIAAFALDQFVRSDRGRKVILTSSLLVTGLCVAFTWQQSKLWRDSITLYQATLARTSSNSVMHNNLGAALLETGKPDQAITHFQQALQIRPNYAEAHSNLGSILLEKKQTQPALEHFLRSAELRPDSPKGWNNVAVAYLRLNDGVKAEEAAQRAVQAEPTDPDARHTLGHALLLQGHAGAAIESFREAIRLRDSSARYHLSLAKALTQNQQLPEAIQSYLRASSIDAKLGQPLLNAARLQVQLKQFDEAESLFKQVLSSTPGDQQARFELGALLLNRGRAPEAAELLAVVGAALPNHPEIQNSLGIALAQSGRLVEARDAFARAVALKPDYADAQRNLARAIAKLSESSPAPAPAP